MHKTNKLIRRNSYTHTQHVNKKKKTKTWTSWLKACMINSHDRTMDEKDTVHRRFTASSTACFLSVFTCSQICCQFLWLTNKADVMCQSTACPLSYHVVSPPSPHLPLFAHWKFNILALPPIGHVRKPTLNIDLEPKAFSAADIVMFLSESSSLQSGGQAGRRQGETWSSPAKSVWAALRKLDTLTPLTENWLLGYNTEFMMRSSAQRNDCLQIQTW